MIFVFCEDGRLEIAEDEAGVLRSYEGIDVESGVFRLFSEAGAYLRPVFDLPVKQRRLLWFVSIVDSGRYHLEEGEIADEDPLWMNFLETSLIEKNRHFSSVQEAKNFLRENGAQVDPPETRPTPA